MRRLRRALPLAVWLILPGVAEGQGAGGTQGPVIGWRDTMRYATAEDALLHLILERIGLVARPGRSAGAGPTGRFSLEMADVPETLARRVRERVQPLLDDSLRADSLGTFRLRLANLTTGGDTVRLSVTHFHSAGCAPRGAPYSHGLGSAGFSEYPAIAVRDSSGWRLERRFQSFADGVKTCP